MAFLDKYKEKQRVRETPPANRSFAGGFLRRLRRFDPVTFLKRQERIGGLLIREEMAELALWEKKITEGGQEAIALALYATAALPEGTIVEGSLLRPEALLAALGELRKEASKPSLESLVVSLPTNLTAFTLLNFPASLSGEQVEEAVHLAAESSFPLPRQDVYYDWVGALGHTIEKQEVIVGMARRSEIEGYLAVVSQAGFYPIAAEPHSMSAARLFPAGNGGRILLVLQPSEVMMVVYHQGLPHLQVHVPRRILEENGKGGPSAIEEKIAELIERINHSSISGYDKIEIKDLVIIPDEENHWGLTPFLQKKQAPKITGLAEAFILPSPDASLRDGWMAAALGAASRGLIPRRRDTMISLMAVGTELAYERARLMSFIDFLQKLGMSLGGFFVLAFGGALLFINTLGRNIEKTFQDRPAPPAEFLTLRDAAVSFNRTVNAIEVLQQKEPRWEELFQEIDRLGSIGTRFRTIDASLQEEGSSPILVEGTAQNRDALLLLKATLENSKVFSFDPLPLPLLLEKENILFTLRLRLKDPRQFFP